MILKKIITSFFLCCLCCEANSLSLNEKLNRFFEATYSYQKNAMHVVLRTPLKKNLHCKKPFFSILSNFHYSGLVDVLLNCDARKYYLQVELQIIGKYVVAKRKIPRGTHIQKSDLKMLIGRLDALPNNTYFKKEDVINRVNLRDIFPLQPITSFITRPFWLVRINQQVTVVFQGDGFVISSTAKSLSNGAQNDTVRIKIKNGKIITGIVNQYGKVIVFL